MRIIIIRNNLVLEEQVDHCLDDVEEVHLVLLLHGLVLEGQVGHELEFVK